MQARVRRRLRATRPTLMRKHAMQPCRKRMLTRRAKPGNAGMCHLHRACGIRCLEQRCRMREEENAKMSGMAQHSEAMKTALLKPVRRVRASWIASYTHFLSFPQVHAALLAHATFFGAPMLLRTLEHMQQEWWSASSYSNLKEQLTAA
eukprot:1158899-Pelagomonas_calceolata.AAC.2